MNRFTGEVVSVSELIERARLALDHELGVLAVEGEVFEYRGPHSSGHFYFKLRDGEASIDVKMWRGTAARGMRCQLQEGRAVLGIGRFDIWPKRGSLSFLLEEVRDLGAGDLARRFEELRQRLRQEGLFDEDRKRLIPLRPRRVALITGAGSAAEADIRRTWQEAVPPFEVLFLPSRVQGEGAAAELIQAVRQAAQMQADVILLARGGGSLEDLWAFNEEALVRALAASPVPVVCAVGHESDTTLCDLVADLREKTPTAGAALLAAGWSEAREFLSRLAADLQRAGRRHMEQAQLALLGQAQHLQREGGRCVRQATQAWKQARTALHGQGPQRRLERARQRVFETEMRLHRAWSDKLARSRRQLLRQGLKLDRFGPALQVPRLAQRLRAAGDRLRAGSPMALLERGYALVEKEGQPGFLRRAEEVQVGEQLRVTLAQGQLRATVDAAGNLGKDGPDLPE